MSGILTRGYTFGATEEVTAAKLHALVDDGLVSGITADEIASGTITDDKINSVSGAKFITLSGVPAGAGVIPKENLTIMSVKQLIEDFKKFSSEQELLEVLNKAEEDGLIEEIKEEKC